MFSQSEVPFSRQSDLAYILHSLISWIWKACCACLLGVSLLPPDCDACGELLLQCIHLIACFHCLRGNYFTENPLTSRVGHFFVYPMLCGELCLFGCKADVASRRYGCACVQHGGAEGSIVAHAAQSAIRQRGVGRKFGYFRLLRLLACYSVDAFRTRCIYNIVANLYILYSNICVQSLYSS